MLHVGVNVLVLTGRFSIPSTPVLNNISTSTATYPRFNSMPITCDGDPCLYLKMLIDIGFQARDSLSETWHDL
jgi:hypothetical protein